MQVTINHAAPGWAGDTETQRQGKQEPTWLTRFTSSSSSSASSPKESKLKFLSKKKEKKIQEKS